MLASRYSPSRCVRTLRRLSSSARRSAPAPTTATATATAASFKDHETTWVDGVDARLQPYLKLIRIDRPTGTFLLLWPCLWGQALATAPGTLVDPVLVAKFALGSLVMRGAGCIVNDLWDRDIDARVERTKGRPLVSFLSLSITEDFTKILFNLIIISQASGAVTPLQAGAFLGTQLAAGLGVLVSFDTHTIGLAASSLVLVAMYPAMKRIFAWPQLFLGLTFNWGALVRSKKHFIFIKAYD